VSRALVVAAAVAAALTLLAPAPERLHAQPALDSLADEAARRTERFRDRRVAMLEGYRRVGPDFPSMGEHWLHSGILLGQRVDAERPTILTYATIDGAPVLLGVGFVVTTRGDSLATGTPGWPAAWHDHSGSLTDESGVGAGRMRATAAASDTRVWVLHVWTRLANPAGRYDSDNWALPFRRLGLDAPADLDADVGRAFSLVTGGDAHLRALLTDAGLRRDGNRDAVDEAIGAAREAAAAIAERAVSRGAATASDAVELRATWRRMGQALRAALGPDVEPFLAPPHGAGHAHHTAAHPPAG
jgi:hypothetical protein